VAPRAAVSPSLVLFDMDDTIFDHSLTCRAALRQVRAEEPRLQARPLDQLFAEYSRMLESPPAGPASSPTAVDHGRAQRFERLARLCGWSMTPEQATDLSRRYRSIYQRSRRPVPGGPEFLRRVARKVQVGIVTNNTLDEQQDKLRFLHLDREVELMVVSDDVGVAKPDPRIFAIALARAGRSARETVMVGDSWTNDVLGARAAGIRPVWFNRFGRPRPTRHRVDEVQGFRPAAPAAALLFPS
jgi:HAD superfamily hydrolase (TIGR01549 family)